MELYKVTMPVEIEIWAADEESAISDACRTHTNWDDWKPIGKKEATVVKIDTES